MDRDEGGLWSSMTYGGRIRQEKWRSAAATGEVIGTCRDCGGWMIPDDPTYNDEAPLVWFTARCLDCGHEVASPEGRLSRPLKRGHCG
jgi:hypothetical protein